MGLRANNWPPVSVPQTANFPRWPFGLSDLAFRRAAASSRGRFGLSLGLSHFVTGDPPGSARSPYRQETDGELLQPQLSFHPKLV